MESIPESKRSQAIWDIYHLEKVKERKLGITWNIEKGIFILFTFFHFLSSFDLLRYISPFAVSAKVFPQELWRIQVDWDKLFSERHQEYWKA